MDDLRRRFASLDQVQAPDLWPEIQGGANETAQGELEVRVARISSSAVDVARTRRGGSLTLLVAALVTLLVAGTIVVGSGNIKRATILTPPSPAPVEQTPAASAPPVPSTSAVSPVGLVAYNVQQPLDPAPQGCTPPDHAS